MATRCKVWGEETRQECSEYRDEGYNECSSWDSECCDWWPCSWVCKLITWFCIAWYWVSNVVCVAWTYITEAVCLVWEVIVLVVGYVAEALLATLGIILDVFGFILELIFSIPFLGAFLRELWNIITELVWRLVGLLDALAWFIGIRPGKKLRIALMMLRDEKGEPVADKYMVVEEINRMIQLYKEEANVQVTKAKYFNEKNPFSDDEIATTDWIIELTSEESAGILDASCGASAVGEDYLLQGSKFNWLMTTKLFWSNGRRLLGYGIPIVVFVVRSISGNVTGCSLNVLSNYLCVVGSEVVDKTTIAHECGHSCGLWDLDEPNTNLMYGMDDNNRHDLMNLQAIVLRNSKNVTYF